MSEEEHVWEIAISTQTKPGSTQVNEGDIVVIREPKGEIGRKEAHAFVWVHVKGFTQDQVANMHVGGVNKWRYSIDLHKLSLYVEEFNEEYAKDLTIFHQPIYDDGSLYASNPYKIRVLPVKGLVFDKVRGEDL